MTLERVYMKEMKLLGTITTYEFGFPCLPRWEQADVST